jgi:hypothetical protein
MIIFYLFNFNSGYVISCKNTIIFLIKSVLDCNYPSKNS